MLFSQRSRFLKPLLVTVLVVVGWAANDTACGQYLRMRDICRVKGQEQNTLQGLGLVVGLNGTGDGDTPSTRALARMMELMGSPVAIDPQRQPLLRELESAKNVALVFVTATVPAEGSRQGDELTCVVNAISAKSLEGGQLMLTPLLGPRPGNPRVYAYAQGPIALDQNGHPTSGKIHSGCRVEADFRNDFVDDGKFTLVLNQNQASFQAAFDIEDLLNNPQVSGVGLGGNDLLGGEPIAKAVDQLNIEVTIPELYRERPVEFISYVLELQIVPPRNEARVVVDKRNGVIVVGENVFVARTAVSHKNISVQTGDIEPLHIVDQDSGTSTTRLQALVDALNALKVDTLDVIEIIESLETSGYLYGHLVVK